MQLLGDCWRFVRVEHEIFFLDFVWINKHSYSREVYEWQFLGDSSVRSAFVLWRNVSLSVRIYVTINNILVEITHIVHKMMLNVDFLDRNCH